MQTTLKKGDKILYKDYYNGEQIYTVKRLTEKDNVYVESILLEYCESSRMCCQVSLTPDQYHKMKKYIEPSETYTRIEMVL